MEQFMVLIALALVGCGCYGVYKLWKSSMRSPRQRSTRNASRNAQNENRNTVNKAICKTGTIVYLANGANPGQDNEFQFQYKKYANGWRAYIVRMPPIHGRDSSTHRTHRVPDQDGYYISWHGEVESLQDMQKISQIWADYIQRYIQTGRALG